MTKREQEILSLIKKNPLMSQNDLANILNITRSSVGVHIANLMKKGLIKGKGYVLGSDYAVVVGASNVDIFGDVENIIMHDSNIGQISTSLGGVGRNIAENIGLLGVDVKLISIVGNDIYGDKILNETSKVDLSNITISDDRTGVYLSIGKEMILAINDMKINDNFTIKHIDKLDSVLSLAKIIVIDTNFSKELIEYTAKKYHDKILILDTVSTVKGSKVKEFLGLFHTIKPNKMEAEMLSGISINNEGDLLKVCSHFHSIGVKDVFITMGDKGVYFSNGVLQGMINSPKVKVVNATGAGDAFVAGLVYGYMNSLGIINTTKAAMKCSEIALRSHETINKNLNNKLIEVE